MLRAQTGPVFLTYRARPEIDEQVNAAIAAEPLFDLTAEDGIQSHDLETHGYPGLE